jgi:hypothetical protein
LGKYKLVASMAAEAAEVEDEEASLRQVVVRHEAAEGHHSIRCRVEVLAVAG